MNSSAVNLQGVAQTLLVPLACRAIESIRPDAIIHDPRAVEVYNALGGNSDFALKFLLRGGGTTKAKATRVKQTADVAER